MSLEKQFKKEIKFTGIILLLILTIENVVALFFNFVENLVKGTTKDSRLIVRHGESSELSMP